MGGMSIVAGLLSYYLPETRWSALPETLEDMENFNNNKRDKKVPVHTEQEMAMLNKEKEASFNGV